MLKGLIIFSILTIALQAYAVTCPDPRTITYHTGLWKSGNWRAGTHFHSSKELSHLNIVFENKSLYAVDAVGNPKSTIAMKDITCDYHATFSSHGKQSHTSILLMYHTEGTPR